MNRLQVVSERKRKWSAKQWNRMQRGDEREGNGEHND